MRGEQRRAHIDAAFRGEAPGDLQLLQLRRGVLAVARLDFDRRHAFVRQSGKTRTTLRSERVLRRGSRGAKRRLNTAAGARDVRIGRAVQPLLEFVRTIAGIDEMRVTIDQAGRCPSAVARHTARRRGAAGNLGRRPDPRNPIAANADGGIANRGITGRVAHRRGMQAVENDVEANRRHRSAIETSQRYAIAREDFRFAGVMPVLHDPDAVTHHVANRLAARSEYRGIENVVRFLIRERRVTAVQHDEIGAIPRGDCAG